jgi:hypothetical protein
MMLMTTALMLLATVGPGESDDAAPPRWLRGNTHTHTLWSDGDAPPETVVAWYVDHGYDFLVLSDHNLVQNGERWFDVSPDGRLTPAKVDAVRERFGDEWPEMATNDDDGGERMRLRTLAELKRAFDRPDEFVLVPGEEVTSSHRLSQIHINALNVDATIPASKGESVQATLQANLDAIIAWGKANDRPVLAHLNHPNFRKSLASVNLAEMRGERFFEVYNGHRSVENERVGDRPSTEEMWDLALVARLHGGAGDGEPLYGIATDDAHDHYAANAVSIPGRGWVMVRCDVVEPDAIIEAMRRGDCYASSGVFLDDIRVEEGRLIVDPAAVVDASAEETLTVEFIGTRVVDGEPGKIGEVLSRVEQPLGSGEPVAYRFADDELYVRARLTSSRPHPRPYAEGDREMAWTQPATP